MDIPDPTGKGGTTKSGNVCDWLLNDHRHILVSLVPVTCQCKIIELLNRICVILSVYTSKYKDVVNTALFRVFCEETYYFILNSFQNSETKWINISPTLHMLLAHSWEIIENHNNTGLGEYSETGLEQNHKFLRFFRQFLAHKTFQETNL